MFRGVDAAGSLYLQTLRRLGITEGRQQIFDGHDTSSVELPRIRPLIQPLIQTFKTHSITLCLDGSILC
jgi:hypothetical protein